MVARIDAGTPCPRLFGITVADLSNSVEALSLSFVPNSLPFPGTTNHSDIIFEQDYQRVRIAISFCPADTSLPTDIFVRH